MLRLTTGPKTRESSGVAESRRKFFHWRDIHRRKFLGTGLWICPSRFSNQGIARARSRENPLRKRSPAQADLLDAVAAHRRGELDKAEAAYRALLRASPD